MKRVTSRHNAALQHVRKLQASRSYRYACGQFVADGTKLFAEALQWLPGLELVVAADNVPLPPLPAGLEELRVPADVMQWISQMQAPQGVLFVGRLPEPRPLSLTPGCLILDGLQDPGNLGTILRTADALEIPVILSSGCADPYSAKTVRASMGAIFRTPPQMGEPQAVLDACRAQKIPLAVTALEPPGGGYPTGEPGGMRRRHRQRGARRQCGVFAGGAAAADHSHASALRIAQCGHCGGDCHVADETVRRERCCNTSYGWRACLAWAAARSSSCLRRFGTPELLFYASRVELAALDCLRRDQIDLMLERDLTPARRIF